MLNNLISFFTRRKQERGPTFRDMHLTIVSLLKENINIRAENKKLREALKPFSDAASTDDYIDDIEIAETDTARKITFGDLRRARIILEGATKCQQN